MILDATSSATTAAGGKAATDARKMEGDLNRFLTLLVTQLQNQDPLQPLDANQFTSQLVQFASVEQQISQNANLEKLLAAQQGSSFASSLGYLGTTVEAAGNALPLQGGGAHATYTLPQTAAEAIVTVKDATTGRTVYTAPVDGAAGRHDFRWDGRSADGEALADGLYAFQVTAKDRSGTSIAATQSYFGQVSGIADDAGGTLLDLGGRQLPVTDVLAIRDRAAAH